ncbi:MAG: 3-deoxy-D-manno-octulosonic acid transferase [Nitrospinaceae bacterium]|nr:MAG: 3-deoxy-D-manno-octulosonic acid transferase [Nitrospinaceae bacterium]
MEIFYHTIVAVAILAASPFILMRMALSAPFRSDLLERLKGGRSLPQLSGCLWIHASSAGEVRAAKILLDALLQNGNVKPIVLSTFTRTGYDLAKKENIENVFRLPPDFPLWLNPLFTKLDPSQLVLIEAELWPSLLRGCKRRHVTVLLVNGRMSQKSADRYQKILPLFRWLADAVAVFSMRTQSDADRVLALGVNPEKVRVAGNIKFDALTGNSLQNDKNAFAEKSSLIVFGSTRPGDEGPVMETILRLKEDFPDLKYVVAPRHLERCQEIEGLIQEFGLELKWHSKLSSNSERDDAFLILVDTMGELNDYYSRACLAFVGGGFNPRFGGQNILEPAAFGIPVVFGKHMNNFEEEARLLQESGGGIQIENSTALHSTLHRLLANPEERSRRGRSAAETVLANQGAVQRTVELIQQTQTDR